MRGKKKKIIARGKRGKKVLILWMKLKWFFQHGFWSFCSALKVKQNRLTRVEAIWAWEQEKKQMFSDIENVQPGTDFLSFFFFWLDMGFFLTQPSPYTHGFGRQDSYGRSQPGKGPWYLPWEECEVEPVVKHFKLKFLFNWYLLRQSVISRY